MLLFSVIAGIVGALVGVGGGILVVPALTLLFGIPIQYAIGASIVSVIATSSGSASAYVRDRITNLRIGMFLEIGSTVGAVIGAVSSIALVRSGYAWAVFLTFGILLFFSAYSSANRISKERKKGSETINLKPNKVSDALNLRGEYYDKATKKNIAYVADKVLAGFGVMVVAGLLSALLGVGGGVLKVVGMDSFMKLPFKVSTTTSNFMIGVTAAASTGIYYVAGFVNPFIAAPVAIGIVIGAFAGTKILVRTKPGALRWVFVVVLIVIALEMVRQGLP
ncbi:MAG: sulfite exporter TauE/SafE family protein [Thaumarchaeota archaeon]|nr:sulfite exporter TauE/SafE family protein [Nitrososphaerota archaeon]